VAPEHVRAIVVWERLRAGRGVTVMDVSELARFIPRWSFNELAMTNERGLHDMTSLREHAGLKAEGIWHDALARISLKDREYYMHCLRNGHRLQAPPQVHIGTIHSVKGGEADHVVLRTDLTYRTSLGLEADPDNEHRVFYVGATRARKHLYLVDPQEGQGYLI